MRRVDMDVRAEEMPSRGAGRDPAAEAPTDPPTDPLTDPLAAARTVAAAAALRAAEEDRDDGFPEADVAALARTGLLAAPVPRRHGGAGLGEEPGARDLCAVLARIGSGSLALGRLYEGHVNALHLIALYARDGQARRLFADAAGGHLFGVWNTEAPGAGLRIEATPDGPVLSGAKTLASGAGRVTRPLVTARDLTSRGDGDGGTLMVVPALDAGARADLSAWRASGMRASATGTVDLTGIPARPDAIVGGPGDYFAQPHFSAGAWRFLAVQLGGIQAVLDAWREHLRATGRGGDPHQEARLGAGAIAAETARLWVEGAAAAARDAAAEPGAAVAYVDLARLAVERAGLDVIEGAQRSVGLQGFLRDHPLERRARDLATYLRQPGPDRALAGGARHVLASPAAAGDLWPPRAGA